MIHNIALLSATTAFCLASATSSETPRVQAGMVVGQLRVAPASGKNALIAIGNEPDQFQMGIDGSGNFLIASPRTTILSADPEDNLRIHASLSTSTLDLQGPFTVRGIPQFRTVYREDFSSGVAEGWDNPASRDIVSSCAGITMLGGYGKFAKGEISKRYSRLPPHKELRVKAVFHFIDAWIGETGFMRLDTGEEGFDFPCLLKSHFSSGPDGGLAYAWTERHSQDFEQNAVNACGGDLRKIQRRNAKSDLFIFLKGPVGEGKFSSPIEVIVPHDKESVAVSFGSTRGWQIQADDPFDQSWGVSTSDDELLSSRCKILAADFCS
ncbi:hypothetical protein Efla_006613 [Eimeria flavescens]